MQVECRLPARREHGMLSAARLASRSLQMHSHGERKRLLHRQAKGHGVLVHTSPARPVAPQGRDAQGSRDRHVGRAAHTGLHSWGPCRTPPLRDTGPSLSASRLLRCFGEGQRLKPLLFPAGTQSRCNEAGHAERQASGPRREGPCSGTDRPCLAPPASRFPSLACLPMLPVDALVTLWQAPDCV